MEIWDNNGFLGICLVGVDGIMMEFQLEVKTNYFFISMQ
jgi:hypothetical protein